MQARLPLLSCILFKSIKMGQAIYRQGKVLFMQFYEWRKRGDSLSNVAY
jgi:hypothetical protein